jgi:hypothetical protein
LEPPPLAEVLVEPEPIHNLEPARDSSDLPLVQFTPGSIHKSSLPQNYPFIAHSNGSLPYSNDSRDVELENGVTVRIKFCHSCNIWRTPRVSY